MIDLKKLACVALTLLVGLRVAGDGVAAQASDFPTMPIKIILPFAPGGYGDLVARVLSAKAGAELGQPIIVENRTGANGIIGIRAAIRSKPDGHTIVQTGTATITLPMMQDDTYDWENGLTPVIGVGSVPLVVAVNASSHIRSIADLAATAKSMPHGINYATGGPGAGQLVPARLVQELKIEATEVPFRGFSGAVQALLGDQVQFICPTIIDVLELVKSGKVRLLAVTSEQRLPYLPDVPTMLEQGFAEFTMDTWSVYQAPANTPRDRIDQLYDAYAKAAEDPGVQQRLGKLGFLIKIRNPDEAAKYMHQESIRWRRIIEQVQAKKG